MKKNKLKRAEINMGLVVSSVIAVSTGVLLFVAFKGIISDTIIPSLVNNIKSLFSQG